MLKFYFNGSPNPTKVALFLEESGLDYEAVPIDARRGQQFDPDYVALNPNAKVPAVDDDGTVVFDSNGILLYLAEKTGQFLPPASQRGELISWLMFVATGIGPYFGQAVHFRNFVPEDRDGSYGNERYQFEAARHYGIADARLAKQQWMVGDTYSIVDMALWGWARMMPMVMGDEHWAEFPNVKRLVDDISARPAAERAVALKDKFDFKANWDNDARRHMFKHMNIAAG
ncbi:MAG: glutathione S-transferase family protein [Alphaproteobacteria bacterium]